MIDILYIDDHLVAVNKPAGLMVHRSRIAPQEKHFALQMVRDMVGCHVYPVHRLDKPTSGALVFGLTPEIAGRMAEDFADRRVSKTYLAVVRGHTEAHGIIDKPLAKYRDKKIRTNIERPARTFYRRLGTIELPYAVSRYPTSRYSLLYIMPETGRLHQIRRHLHHISHPVIGDRAHGDGRHNRFFKETFHCSRLMLAAVEVSFSHPVSKKPFTVSAPLDQCFSSLLKIFNWHNLIPSKWLSATEAYLSICHH